MKLYKMVNEPGSSPLGGSFTHSGGITYWLGEDQDEAVELEKFSRDGKYALVRRKGFRGVFHSLAELLSECKPVWQGISQKKYEVGNILRPLHPADWEKYK